MWVSADAPTYDEKRGGLDQSRTSQGKVGDDDFLLKMPLVPFYLRVVKIFSLSAFARPYGPWSRSLDPGALPSHRNIEASDRE